MFVHPTDDPRQVLDTIGREIQDFVALKIIADALCLGTTTGLFKARYSKMRVGRLIRVETVYPCSE